MNIRVDLILDSEKRSASLLNTKSLTRISIIVAPVVILVVILLSGLGVMNANVKLNNLSNRWEIAEKKQTEARALRDEAAVNNQIKNELLGWRASHMDWGEQLLALQRIAPRNMQFTLLNISQSMQLEQNKFPSRNFVMTLSGKSKGAPAEADINQFIETIQTSVIFTDPIESVSIENFGEDRDENASRQDRVFKIKCTYKPKLFREIRKTQ